jgi:YidC/Oxa1 family membrane protein insertase
MALSNGLAPLAGGLAVAAAIVVFTIAVRLVVLPFSYYAMRGQAAQARLAPQVQALRQRYAKQPERLRRELAALYDKSGTSMYAGCLPLLLQWPFLSLMYLLFRSPVIDRAPNVLLTHYLFGTQLGSHVLSGAGLLSPHGAVFAAVFVLLAGIGWLSARAARQMPPPAATAAAEAGPGQPVVPAWLTRLTFVATPVIAAFMPLAAGLCLLTTTAWTLLEKSLLRRALPAAGQQPAGGLAEICGGEPVLSLSSQQVTPVTEGLMVKATGRAVPSIATSPIRRLGAADLAACVALSVDRDWGAEQNKWSLLLEVAEGYGVDDPDGGLAGAVVLGRYGTRLASVGMMLVASRHGRQGLGRALMTHVIEQAGDATVFLTATTYGRPLYERLGFRTVGRSAAFTGEFRGLAGDGPDQTRSAVGEDIAAVIEVDRRVFGAVRRHMLRPLFSFADQVRVLPAGGGIAGYAAAWRDVGTTVIGPVIAPDASSAGTLIAAVARRIDGPVRVDLDPDRREIAGWAQTHGLPQVAETAFMVHGIWPPPGYRNRLFAPITVALG